MDPRSVVDNKERLQVIDVREPYEWEAGRIEGARHIPMADLPNRLGDIGGAGVVTVCRTGNRSGKMAELLRAEGIDAENMEGGMLAWDEAGLPITTPEGRPGKVAEH